ncbi:hypothetical protein ACFQQB_62165 [Nonomuraea rubra]|uniref:hypothetical protein n=1 Tax=Nonomuraea rubra TaxID=46180 RepID=UPI00360EC899
MILLLYWAGSLARIAARLFRPVGFSGSSEVLYAIDSGSIDMAYTWGISSPKPGSLSFSGEAYSISVPCLAPKSAHAWAAFDTTRSAGELPVACSLSTRWNTSSLSRLLAAIFVTHGYFLLKSRKIGAQFSWSVLE